MFAISCDTMRAIPEGEFHRKYHYFYSTLLESEGVYIDPSQPSQVYSRGGARGSPVGIGCPVAEKER
jgi:hypothetical protein